MQLKNEYLKVKDHAVSGEEFHLHYNENLDMLETVPQPSASELSNYYHTEDYISHTDSKRNLFERVYHFIRTITLKRKIKLINSLAAEGRELLDFGCGTGDFLSQAKQNGWQITGIETNDKARSIAKGKTAGKIYKQLNDRAVEKMKFDVITLWHVLEHLPNLEEHISKFKRILKPTGTIIIAVPNYKSFDATYYKSHWAGYDVPRHLWHFSKHSISKLFMRQNMIIEKTRPMKFDAYYVSLLSEKYKSGWMNIFSAFFVATRSNLIAGRTGQYSSLIFIIKNA